MGEAGGEGFEGAALVARHQIQCYLKITTILNDKERIQIVQV